MAGDALLLAIAIVCAVAYGSVLLVLIWNNPDSGVARGIVVAAIVFWPYLFLAGPTQLLIAIPIATVFAIDGVRLGPTVSAKAAAWALGATVAYMAIAIAIGFLESE